MLVIVISYEIEKFTQVQHPFQCKSRLGAKVLLIKYFQSFCINLSKSFNDSCKCIKSILSKTWQNFLYSSINFSIIESALDTNEIKKSFDDIFCTTARKCQLLGRDSNESWLSLAGSTEK